MNLFEAVKSSREYSLICDETIMRIVTEREGRYKSEKLALKSIKSALREISGAFLDSASLKRAEELVFKMDGMDEDSVRALTFEILSLHKSTKERLHFYKELIDDIRRITNFSSVIDIGCGFNPLFLPYMNDWRSVYYLAGDINLGVIKLLEAFFERIQAKARAFPLDAVSYTPSDKADCAFIFKTLPLLERHEKGAGRKLADRLDCTFLAVTFPTKSLGGRNVGMEKNYINYIDHEFSEYEKLFTKSYPNEMMFIMKKF